MAAYNRYTLCEFCTVCFERLSDERDIAILDHRFHGLFYMHSFYSTSSKPKAVALEENLNILLMAVIVNKMGCMLHTRLEEIQRRLASSGLLNLWVDAMYENSFKNYYNVLKVEQTIALQFSHLQGAFYLLIIGLCLGTVAFIIELSCWKIVHH